MEKPAAQTNSGNRIVSRPKLVRIAADQDWQHPCLLPQLRTDDAALCCKYANLCGNFGHIQLGTVAVIGIFNQHPLAREGQDIDEAITIALRHRGIHHHGAVRIWR